MMKMLDMKKIVSMIMTMVMVLSFCGDVFAVSAYATDGEILRDAVEQVTETTVTPEPVQEQICVLCGTAGHTDLDCPNKCREQHTWQLPYRPHRRRLRT